MGVEVEGQKRLLPEDTTFSSIFPTPRQLALLYLTEKMFPIFISDLRRIAEVISFNNGQILEHQSLLTVGNRIGLVDKKKHADMKKREGLENDSFVRSVEIVCENKEITPGFKHRLKSALGRCIPRILKWCGSSEEQKESITKQGLISQDFEQLIRAGFIRQSTKGDNLYFEATSEGKKLVNYTERLFVEHMPQSHNGVVFQFNCRVVILGDKSGENDYQWISQLIPHPHPKPSGN